MHWRGKRPPCATGFPHYSKTQNHSCTFYLTRCHRAPSPSRQVQKHCVECPSKCVGHLHRPYAGSVCHMQRILESPGILPLCLAKAYARSAYVKLALVSVQVSLRLQRSKDSIRFSLAGAQIGDKVLKAQLPSTVKKLDASIGRLDGLQLCRLRLSFQTLIAAKCPLCPSNKLQRILIFGSKEELAYHRWRREHEMQVKYCQWGS